MCWQALQSKRLLYDTLKDPHYDKPGPGSKQRLPELLPQIRGRKAGYWPLSPQKDLLKTEFSHYKVKQRVSEPHHTNKYKAHLCA